MKAVKVEYMVRSEYVAQNKVNIARVMRRLRQDPIDGMLYSTYTLDDGQSFVHINIARDEETMNKLNDLEEFTAFRMALKESSPIKPPHATNLNFVDGGFEL